ncbi:deoxynucleoside kinase [Candidatus Latescibacterota bacterium]
MEEKKIKCPYHYIAVEGVIGVGKTSLCTLIAEQLGGRPYLEDFESNPFIRDFYSAQRANAFKTQLYFLISRFKKQLEMPLPDLFHSPLVADFIFQKDRIFASVTLDDDELELYNTVINVLEPKVNPPDLVLYLQASTKVLLERIRKRGRDYEQNISYEYLEALNNAYNEFFFHYSLAPVFILNTDDVDFMKNKEHISDLISKLVESHSGIYFYHPRGM